MRSSTVRLRWETGKPVLFLTAAFMAIAATDASGRSEDPWTNAIQHRFNESNTQFEKLIGNRSDRDIDSLRFGYALTLLNRQPRNKMNIQRAGSIFLALYGKDPDSDFGIASLYYMGRIAHVHQTPFDWKEAARIYEKLIEAHPDHFFAQLALSKSVTVQLYDSVPEEERKERFERLADLSTRLTIPPIKAHFHYHMSEAAMRLDLSRREALTQILEAVDAGITNWRARVDAYVMVAELAREEGDYTLARKFYNKVLQEFPVDARTDLIASGLIPRSLLRF